MLPSKKYQKKLQQKNRKKQATTKNRLCVCFLFVSAVVLCD
jgi:hypothetical protein